MEDEMSKKLSEMPKEKLVELICKDPRLFNKWWGEEFDVDPNGRLDLSGADLSGADLRGVQFVDVDLTGANFSHARLDGADFNGVVSIAGAKFGGACTDNAKFFGVDLTDVDIRDLNVSFRNARRAKLRKSQLDDIRGKNHKGFVIVD